MKKLNSFLFLVFISVRLLAGADDDLWAALIDLNPAGVKAALSAGADVMKLHPTFGSPLNYAAAFGNAELIQVILDAKPVIDAEHPAAKSTPLASAATWGNLEGVLLLLKAGANPSKEFPSGNILSASFLSGNADVIRAVVDAGADVKKPIIIANVESAPLFQFALTYRTPAAEVEYFRQMKPILEKMGVVKLPEWMSNPSEDRFSPVPDALQVLIAGGADINGIQEIKGTKSKKAVLAWALEQDRDDIADVLTAAGADKNAPGMKEVLAVMKANEKTTPFNEATANASKVKVIYDFPREGRHAGGAGYSANMSLLKEKPKRIALISYYVYDAGKGKSKLNAAVWRTPDAKGQAQVNAFYNKSIGPMKTAFKERGIDLLTPQEFITTEDIAETYYGFVQETAKRERTTISRATARMSTYDGPVFTTKVTTTTTATVGTLKVCPAGKGYRPFFVVNEGEDESDPVNFQGGIFTANRKLTSSLGYELCQALGVDAVMVVYIATRKPKRATEEYGVNAVVSVILGPNPGKGQDTDPGAKNLGQFYCGTRTFYSSPEIFQIEKARPKVDGIENILVKHAGKLCDYLMGKDDD